MHECPHCSHDLLRQLNSKNLYWYCRRCRIETSIYTTVSPQSVCDRFLDRQTR